jgi:transcriptional regulator with XRE-family HTH domain
MYVGKTIRKIRLEKLYKQSYIAEKLGMSQTNYSNIENDITNISEEQINKIANIFEVSPNDIIRSAEKKTSKGPSNEISNYELNHLKETITILKEEVAFLQEMLRFSNNYNKTLLDNKLLVESHLNILIKEREKEKNK